MRSFKTPGGTPSLPADLFCFITLVASSMSMGEMGHPVLVCTSRYHVYIHGHLWVQDLIVYHNVYRNPNLWVLTHYLVGFKWAIPAYGLPYLLRVTMFNKIIPMFTSICVWCNSFEHIFVLPFWLYHINSQICYYRMYLSHLRVSTGHQELAGFEET